jgi:aromatic ring hydroxylase
MGARTGKQYVEGLRDGRHLYVNGALVRDVTTYPPFEGVIREIAGLYDLHHNPALRSDVTYPSPRDGAPVSSSFLHVRTWDDMEHRIKGERIRAESVFGMMGRMPDFMNAFVADMASAHAHFGRNRPEFGRNIWNYYELCRDQDLCLTHTLVDPQIDRSKGPSAQEALRIVKETDRGIVVSGARMLSTLAAVSDEIMVAPYSSRRPGEEDYAICFALPINAPGLTFVCRETYDRGASTFDRPLTSRYDEGDALAVFDNVTVPWDRVFAARDLETYNLIRLHLQGYPLLQAVIRATVKLRFMTGLATLVARAVGRDQLPRYQEILGELVANVELAEGLLLGGAHQLLNNVAGLGPIGPDAAEPAAKPLAPGAGAKIGGSHGTLYKGLTCLTTVRMFFPRVQQQAVEAIRMMGGSGLVMTPCDQDFANPDLNEILSRHLRGSTMPARDRVRIMKLAWDAISGDFGGRQLLYEWFFAGDPFNNRLLYFGTERHRECVAATQRLLDKE